MNFFNTLEVLPEDPIFSLPEAFKKDTREKKVDLTVGAYRNEEGNPQPLKVIEKAQKINLENRKEIEYLPIMGFRPFLEKAEELLFGNSLKAPKKPLLSSCQSLGGTGALRTIGDLLKEAGFKKILISEPTWPNHKAIFLRAGLKVDTYSYLDISNRKVNMKNMLKVISGMSLDSVLLLQPSCHNPTGLNFTLEEWREILIEIKKRNIFILFDVAYQGFGQDLEQDVFPLKEALQLGIEYAVAYSFSKNMGLYGERVGFLSVVSFQDEIDKKVKSHLSHIARQTYSNPPRWGMESVFTILSDKNLKKEWEIELAAMKERIESMRKKLTHLLNTHTENLERNFLFLLEQQGLFAFTGLNKDEIHRLRVEKGIYLPSSGRVNLSNLNDKNIEYVATSMVEVIQEI